MSDGRRLPVWINGRLIEHARLRHHDTVEFGDRGPVSRLRVYRDSEPPTIGVADILSDTAAYLRSSRKPLASRLLSALSQLGGRLARETTLLFRLGVIAALVLIGFLAWQQSRINALMRERIETGTAQLQSYSKLLAEVRKDALTPADLAKLSEELSGRVATATERIAELEKRSSAIARVIEQARPAILFLQGSYAFREVASGRMLRHVVGPQGDLPNGLPLLSLSGAGPVAERQFTGTGFVVGDDGMIVTSRHVGQPWLYDTNVKALAGNGLEPVPIRFLAYFTDGGSAREISIAGVSEVADVALLRLEVPVPDLTGLKLAESIPRPGDDVILIGYPAGIRSMVAHAGAKFIEQLKQDDVSDFWQIAARLSEERRILPLASRGIVARVSPESIVYDAETTYGGSGGPVLNSEGRWSPSTPRSSPSMVAPISARRPRSFAGSSKRRNPTRRKPADLPEAAGCSTATVPGRAGGDEKMVDLDRIRAVTIRIRQLGGLFNHERRFHRARDDGSRHGEERRRRRSYGRGI
jgi:serine protease Do